MHLAYTKTIEGPSPSWPTFSKFDERIGEQINSYLFAYKAGRRFGSYRARSNFLPRTRREEYKRRDYINNQDNHDYPDYQHHGFTERTSVPLSRLFVIIHCIDYSILRLLAISHHKIVQKSSSWAHIIHMTKRSSRSRRIILITR